MLFFITSSFVASGRITGDVFYSFTHSVAKDMQVLIYRRISIINLDSNLLQNDVNSNVLVLSFNHFS